MFKISSKRLIRGLIILPCLLASVLLPLGETAFADRREHRDHSTGTVVRSLPHGSGSVWVGRSRYHYHSGVFYRQGPSGFLVVGAPVGAVILGIPIGSRAVIVGGITYYTYGGAYYRRVPRGYVVVEPPRETVIMKEVSPVVPSEQRVREKVAVVAPQLNVRSGPGMNFPVTHQVYENDVMTVHGYAPDWLYVELSTGEFGWVMLRHTRPVSLPPTG